MFLRKPNSTFFIIIFSTFISHFAYAQFVTDTLWYPVLQHTDSVKLYRNESTSYPGGYISGTNGYEDLLKGQRFNFPNYPTKGYVTKILVWFGAKEIVGTADSIYASLYAVDSSNSLPIPLSVRYSQKVCVCDLDTSSSAMTLTEFNFSPADSLSGNFIVSVLVDDGVNDDTVAVISNRDGNGNKEKRAVELWSNYQWHFFDGGFGSWDKDVDLFIFPVVQGNFPDAGIVNILLPAANDTVFLPAEDTLWVSVEVENFSPFHLDSVRISYQLGTDSPVTEKINLNKLPPAYTRIDTFSIPIIFPSADSAYLLKCWASFPNGLGDSSAVNDTMSVQIVTRVPSGISDVVRSGKSGLNIIYPNPVNGSLVKINYSLVKTSDVEIIFSNPLGQELRKNTWKKISPGNYTMNFEIGDLPAGIYLLRMRTEDFNTARRVVLMK